MRSSSSSSTGPRRRARSPARWPWLRSAATVGGSSTRIRTSTCSCSTTSARERPCRPRPGPCFIRSGTPATRSVTACARSKRRCGSRGRISPSRCPCSTPAWSPAPLRCWKNCASATPPPSSRGAASSSSAPWRDGGPSGGAGTAATVFCSNRTSRRARAACATSRPCTGWPAACSACRTWRRCRARACWPTPTARPLSGPGPCSPASATACTSSAGERATTWCSTTRRIWPRRWATRTATASAGWSGSCARSTPTCRPWPWSRTCFSSTCSRSSA